MPNKQPIAKAMNDHLDRLLGADEWESTLDAIRELVYLPIVDSKLDRNIKNWIVEPLEGYIQAGWEKTGNRHNTGTQTGMNLLIVTEDMAHKLKHGRQV